MTDEVEHVIPVFGRVMRHPVLDAVELEDLALTFSHDLVEVRCHLLVTEGRVLVAPEENLLTVEARHCRQEVGCRLIDGVADHPHHVLLLDHRVVFLDEGVDDLPGWLEGTRHGAAPVFAEVPVRDEKVRGTENLIHKMFLWQARTVLTSMHRQSVVGSPTKCSRNGVPEQEEIGRH